MIPEVEAASPRVVSLIASGTEIVAALGMGGHLVGRSHSCDYPGWVERLPVLTEPKVDPEAPSDQIDTAVRTLLEDGLSVYRIDSDRLARLKPDVVVTQDHCEVCAVSLSEVEAALWELDLLDTRVCSLLPRDLSDVRGDFERVARALEVPERGTALLKEFNDRLEQVHERIAGFPVPRIVMIEWLDPPMVAGGWMPELARIAGTEPLLVTEGESRSVSWEAIAGQDPDQVLIFPCGFDISRSREEIRSPRVRERLESIRAVRAGRCSILDGQSYFNRPGPRLAESTELLAVACHPGALPALAQPYGGSISNQWAAALDG